MTVLSLPNEQTCGREIPAASISLTEFDLIKRATDGSQTGADVLALFVRS